MNIVSKCFSFLKVATNQRYAVSEKNWWKISEQILTVAYLHLILFRIHEKDTATEIKFDIVIQMTLVYVLTKRSKQSVK